VAKRLLAPLRIERLRLRLLEERDLPLTLAWRNQPHIRRWFFHGEPIAPAEHAAWYARYRERDDDFLFIIEEEKSESPRLPATAPAAAPSFPRPVGQIGLYNIDWQRRSGEFGRLMIGAADAAGRGLAQDATRALVAMARDRLGLEELHLEVFAENAAAIRVYAVNGFQAVGRDDAVLRMSLSLVQTATTL
jgi:RimJ/RimL family protein N-acetyltransferase